MAIECFHTVAGSENAQQPIQERRRFHGAAEFKE